MPPHLVRVTRCPRRRSSVPASRAVGVGWLEAASFPRDPAPCCDRVRLTMSQWDVDNLIRAAAAVMDRFDSPIMHRRSDLIPQTGCRSWERRLAATVTMARITTAPAPTLGLTTTRSRPGLK